MSNSCDKNDKVHKRKYFSGCKNPIYERIKTDVPAILIAKGVRKMIDRISLILVIIGALNWGSIGLFKFDIVAWICGGQGSMRMPVRRMQILHGELELLSVSAG